MIFAGLRSLSRLRPAFWKGLDLNVNPLAAGADSSGKNRRLVRHAPLQHPSCGRRPASGNRLRKMQAREHLAKLRLKLRKVPEVSRRSSYPTGTPATWTARASMVPSVGAAKLINMCGELGLAKTRSSAWGILAVQTLEYRSIGREKARQLKPWPR